MPRHVAYGLGEPEILEDKAFPFHIVHYHQTPKALDLALRFSEADYLRVREQLETQYGSRQIESHADVYNGMRRLYYMFGGVVGLIEPIQDESKQVVFKHELLDGVTQLIETFELIYRKEDLIADLEQGQRKQKTVLLSPDMQETIRRMRDEQDLIQRAKEILEKEKADGPEKA